MRTLIAMTMLASASEPDISELRRQIQALTNVGFRGQIRREGEVTAFQLNRVQIMTVTIPHPIPWGDLEGPSQTAPFWPDATESVRSHIAHMITTASSDDDPKALAFGLTKGIQALIASVDAIGVYWGSATLVTSKEAFLALSRDSSQSRLPLYLWVDFRCCAETDGSLTVFTVGMPAFQLMNIEIRNAQGDPWALKDIAYEIAHYLLDKGPAIKDGDTIPCGPRGRIKVEFAPSMLARDETVYNLLVGSSVLRGTV